MEQPERERVLQALMARRAELVAQREALTQVVAALDTVIQLYENQLHPAGRSAPMPAEADAGRFLEPEGPFAHWTYAQMLRQLARESGGRIRVSEAARQVRARGGARRSKDLYTTLATQLQRMPKEFRRVAPGEWEWIGPSEEGDPGVAAPPGASMLDTSGRGGAERRPVRWRVSVMSSAVSDVPA